MAQYFVCAYDYQSPSSESELAFKEGDLIKLVSKSDDWWLGEHLGNGKQGWFSPNYGRLSIAFNEAYQSLSAEQKATYQKQAIQEIVATEQGFIDDLLTFKSKILAPLELKDTPFKREFLADHSIAVCFSILIELLHSCSSFLEALKKSRTPGEIATVFNQFTPTLALYGQFAGDYVAGINALQVFSKQIDAYESTNPFPFKMEHILMLPMSHYSLYFTKYSEYVWSTISFDSKGDSKALASSLDNLKEEHYTVAYKIQESDDRIKLLALQACFSGNVSIYTPSRRLIHEGLVERVKKSKGNIVSQKYYMHLFNDCVVYSSTGLVNFNKFKMHKMIDLNGAKISQMEPTSQGLYRGFTNTFVIEASKSGDSDFADIFRCDSMDETKYWIHCIESVLNSLSAQNQRIVHANTAVSFDNLDIRESDVNDQYAKIIHKFLSGELAVAQCLQTMCTSVIKPMSDATKGAVLHAVLPQDLAKKKELQHYKLDNSQTKAQIQAITEALKESDIQNWLRATETLSQGCDDLVKSIKSECEGKNWSSNILIGKFFTSLTMKNLMNQYKKYATVQQGTIRILRNPNFAYFCKEADLALSLFPGTFAEKIETPVKRPTIYLELINKLIDDLNRRGKQQHEDYRNLMEAKKEMEAAANEIDSVVKNRSEFEKLLAIQASMTSTTQSSGFGSLMGAKDPFLEKLASTDRRLLKQGDLKKVCRKKNQTFHFWLFNDYLMYAESTGNNTYCFHRALDLKKTSVTVHNNPSVKNAFEIHGSEKSFIVIAPTQGVQADWVLKISEAKNAIAPGSSEQTTAPLWVPDSGSSGCCVCSKTFGIFTRRHHCRACGKLVCNDHSQKKLLLDHIDKTVQQRVCDLCHMSHSKGTQSSKGGQQASAVVTKAPPTPVVTNPTPVVSTPTPVVTNPTPVAPSASTVSVAADIPPTRKESARRPEEVVKNPFDEGVAAKNPFDEGVAAKNPFEEEVAVKNPFDEVPPPPRGRHNTGGNTHAVPDVSTISIGSPPPPPPPVNLAQTSRNTLEVENNGSRPPPPPPPASLQVPTQSDNRPPPPPPPPGRPQAEQHVVDERLAPYIKLRTMGTPDGAIRGRMQVNGFTQAEIDGLLGPDLSASAPREPYRRPTATGPAPPTQQRAAPGPPLLSANLADQIKESQNKLRTVDKSTVHPAMGKPVQKPGNIFDQLKEAMDARRKVQVDDKSDGESSNEFDSGDDTDED